MELKALRKDLAYYKSQVELLEKEKRTIERGTCVMDYIIFPLSILLFSVIKMEL